MKEKIQGKLEELMGRMTGDKATEMRGRARQGLGEIKGTAKEIRHDVEHRDDSTYPHRERDA